MTDPEPRQLTPQQLEHIREHFGVTRVVSQLLGHIAWQDAEIDRKQAYYDGYLVPKLLEDQAEERAGWRKRLENEGRRVNPAGLPAGR